MSSCWDWQMAECLLKEIGLAFCLKWDRASTDTGSKTEIDRNLGAQRWWRYSSISCSKSGHWSVPLAKMLFKLLCTVQYVYRKKCLHLTSEFIKLWVGGWVSDWVTMWSCARACIYVMCRGLCVASHWFGLSFHSSMHSYCQNAAADRLISLINYSPVAC